MVGELLRDGGWPPDDYIVNREVLSPLSGGHVGCKLLETGKAQGTNQQVRFLPSWRIFPLGDYVSVNFCEMCEK